jgi:autotransporter-associated beta strand protein
LSSGSNLDLRDTTINTFNILGNGGVGGGNSLVTTAAATNFFFDINATGADRIVLSRAAAATGGTINVSPITGTTSLPIGVVPLITAAGGFTGTGTNNFTLGTTSITVGSKTYSLTLAGAQDTTTQTALNITVSTTAAFWAGTVDGNWNTGAGNGVTNWRTDATSNIDTQTPPTSGTDVVFATTTPTTTNLATTTGAPMSINSLTFTSAASPAVSIGDGGTAANNLTIGAGGLTTQAGAGTVTISANVVLGTSQTWTHNSSNALTVNGGASGTLSGAGNNLTITGSGNTTINALIQTGSGGLTMSGTGRLALTGANTYSGGTTVSAGLLLANNASGSATGSGGVSVNGGVVGGFGSIAGALTLNNGAVNPGDPAGSATNRLKVLRLSTPGGGSASVAIDSAGNSTAGTDYDQLQVTDTVAGALNVGGAALTFASPAFQHDGVTPMYILANVNAADTVVGRFATINGLPLFDAGDGQTYNATDGNGTNYTLLYDVNFSLAGSNPAVGSGNDIALVTNVPEPSSIGLLGLGVAAGLLARRRRRRAGGSW